MQPRNPLHAVSATGHLHNAQPSLQAPRPFEQIWRCELLLCMQSFQLPSLVFNASSDIFLIVTKSVASISVSDLLSSDSARKESCGLLRLQARAIYTGSNRRC